MNTKSLLITLVAIFALSVNAQTDYSFYLSRAWEKVNSGKCEAAQRSYDVYKELTNKRNVPLEEAIAKCEQVPQDQAKKQNAKPVQEPNQSQPQKKKAYAIGDDAYGLTIYSGYKIAYLDATGKHGFAIQEGLLAEAPPISTSPTIDELRRIYWNRKSLGLKGEYWSNTLVSTNSKKWYTLDFSTGETRRREWRSEVMYKTIKVIRF